MDLLEIAALAVLAFCAMWGAYAALARLGFVGRRSRGARAYDTDYEDQEDFDDYSAGGSAGGGASGPGVQRPFAASVDLLPKPPISQQDWSEFAPDVLAGQNFINTPRFLSMDTIGNSRRNSSYDLRGGIPVAKAQLDFYNSSLDADQRRPLEGL